MAIAPAAAYDEIFDFLTSTPTPEQIVSFQPSNALQNRIHYLLEANRNGTLTTEERVEMDEFAQVEHLMRLLKAHARVKLAQP